MLARITIKKNELLGFKLSMTALKLKSGRLSRYNWASYDKKLANSISRARTKIFEYSVNNDFYYYVTLTANDNFNSYDLDYFRTRLTQLIRDLRKRYGGEFKYLLIPEKHKKGNYHFHGFFSKDFCNDFYINEYNYFSWASFDKFGFSNIQEIRNKEASCKYITKYITKDLFDNTKGKHMYFVSKGLNLSKKVLDVVVSGYDTKFDFSNDYVSIKYIDINNMDSELLNVSKCLINYYN